jgi:hypothetical protein
LFNHHFTGVKRVAYILADDKLKDQNQADPNQQGQNLSQGSNVVGGSGFSQAPTSTAGVGAGGTGGWTNIQAYLNANQGDQGGTKLLNDNVGSQFDTEKSGLQSKANEATTQAQAQVGQVNSVKDNAQSLVDKGGAARDWGGNHGSDYNNALNSFKSALGGQYQGPKSFDYGFQDKTNNYGSALGSDESFSNLMNDFYAQKGGGTLNSGGRELQKQLNVSNEGLASARQALLQKYGDLGNQQAQTVKGTSDAIAKAQSDYTGGQGAIRNFLSGKNQDYSREIGQAEQSARDAFGKDYGAKSGLNAAGYDYLTTQYNPYPVGRVATEEEQAARDAYVQQYPLVQQRQAAGLLSDNLGYDQLQKEQDLFGNATGAASTNIDRNKAALEKFYGDQNAKFANTADEQKRKYNLIQEILGQNDLRSQGFKVRG